MDTQNKPIRVQRKRTKGWKMPPNTVYVGRPTKWGNPFKKNGEEDVVAWYSNYIKYKMSDEVIIRDLKGKNLACFCPLDKPCHADILLEIANS